MTLNERVLQCRLGLMFRERVCRHIMHGVASLVDDFSIVKAEEIARNIEALRTATRALRSQQAHRLQATHRGRQHGGTRREHCVHYHGKPLPASHDLSRNGKLNTSNRALPPGPAAILDRVIVQAIVSLEYVAGVKADNILLFEKLYPQELSL
ncbi:hypothetical protein HPB50_017218 [Hyalomma asiaticum]|uniref:Uncharacterized protein n=1 Tax=Hyalomma asiaticum TaxID=266040 RepID=A0ACB7T8E9_HYAAI|nr:hypothetical protein HPB50_017218 [Hyalomma asiaticum]